MKTNFILIFQCTLVFMARLLLPKLNLHSCDSHLTFTIVLLKLAILFEKIEHNVSEAAA